MLGAEPDEEGDEAEPLKVPGAEKVLSSADIRKYYTPALFHYHGVYLNCKRHGLPYPSFLEAPGWVIQLLAAFDRAYEDVRDYARRKNTPRAGGRAARFDDG